MKITTQFTFDKNLDQEFNDYRAFFYHYFLRTLKFELEDKYDIETSHKEKNHLYEFVQTIESLTENKNISFTVLNETNGIELIEVNIIFDYFVPEEVESVESFTTGVFQLKKEKSDSLIECMKSLPSEITSRGIILQQYFNKVLTEMNNNIVYQKNENNQKSNHTHKNNI